MTTAPLRQELTGSQPALAASARSSSASMVWSSAVSRCSVRDNQPGERVSVTGQAYGAPGGRAPARRGPSPRRARPGRSAPCGRRGRRGSSTSVPRGGGRGRVALALLHGDDVVAGAVHAEDRRARRQQAHRVGDGVALRHLRRARRRGSRGRRRCRAAGRAAAARSRTPAWSTAAVTRTRGAAPGAPAGSRCRPASQAARCPPAEWPMAVTSVRSRRAASGRPGRQSSAAATSSAVAGPAAAGAHAAVLHGDRGEAGRGEVGRERPGELDAVGRPPEARRAGRRRPAPGRGPSGRVSSRKRCGPRPVPVDPGHAGHSASGRDRPAAARSRLPGPARTGCAGRLLAGELRGGLRRQGQRQLLADRHRLGAADDDDARGSLPPAAAAASGRPRRAGPLIRPRRNQRGPSTPRKRAGRRTGCGGVVCAGLRRRGGEDRAGQLGAERALDLAQRPALAGGARREVRADVVPDAGGARRGERRRPAGASPPRAASRR